MRVYFNLVDRTDHISDLDGVDVDDLEHAYAEAETAVAELIQEKPSAIHEVSGWRLDAVDTSGTLLFSISLDSVIDRVFRGSTPV